MFLVNTWNHTTRLKSLLKQKVAGVSTGCLKKEDENGISFIKNMAGIRKLKSKYGSKTRFQSNTPWVSSNIEYRLLKDLNTGVYFYV